MSTETKELNRLFNNISGGTVNLKLPQTKWLQMINEWIEENGIGGGGDGSSYKGVTVLNTSTHINDGSELPTTYDFMIASVNPIEGAKDYWGEDDGMKSYLLIHHLNNGETVLTPVLLFSTPDNDSETGGYIYNIQVLGQSSPITFSSVELQGQNTLVAHLDNALQFNILENNLKAGSLIQSGSGDVIADEPLKLIAGTGMTSSGIPGGNSSSSHFRFSIAIPQSIIEAPSEEKLSAYLNGAKLCYWTDESDGTEYLDFIRIEFSETRMAFNFNDDASLVPLQSRGDPDSGVMYFDFDGSAKKIFVQNALNGSGGGSSSGPNYQMPITDSGNYGSGWYAEIRAAASPRITIKNLEVDENYMLLRLTYQEISEGESPIETKVFSIIHLEGQGAENPTEKTYYIVWSIEQNYTIYETTEDAPQPTNSYLKFYPTIIGFNPQYKE